MLPALLLCVVAAAAPLAGAAPLEGKALFDARAAAWREVRGIRQKELGAMVAALKSQPAIVAGLLKDWKSDMSNEASQVGLAKTLAENQFEAARDGVVDASRRDVHVARLDRLLSERLFFLWGHTVPARWNFRLEGVAKVLKVPGYPFSLFPTKAEYEAFATKDFVPVYEKSEGRMKSVGLEEPAGRGAPAAGKL